jgi:hypothetical protein
MEAVHQNGHFTQHTLLRLAFADHMDRLVASESSSEEIRVDTTALTGALLGSGVVPSRQFKSVTSSPLQKRQEQVAKRLLRDKTAAVSARQKAG